MDLLIEKIYNTYLKVSRSQNQKPFRYRKNFENFENEAGYLPSLKLKNFFTRHPEIKIEDYFIAPYIVFSETNDKFFDLSFYNTQQAIKVYTLYSRKIMLEDPDSELQLEKITNGLKFIKNFCISKKIPLKEYLNYKSEKVHDFLIHLSNKEITIYNLFPLKNLDKQLKLYDYELLSFILKDLSSRIAYFRTRFSASNHAKQLSTQGLKKIEKIINLQLEF